MVMQTCSITTVDKIIMDLIEESIHLDSKLYILHVAEKDSTRYLFESDCSERCYSLV